MAPLILQVPFDRPITDGNVKFCECWECVDPVEGVIVTPHCYVNGRCHSYWSHCNSIRFLAAVDANNHRRAHLGVRGQVNCRRNRGIPRAGRRWKAGHGAVRRLHRVFGRIYYRVTSGVNNIEDEDRGYATTLAMVHMRAQGGRKRVGLTWLIDHSPSRGLTSQGERVCYWYFGR